MSMVRILGALFGTPKSSPPGVAGDGGKNEKKEKLIEEKQKK